ncbi:hypothetical protein QTP88_019323 [Uroleucon formosanum]
MAKKKEQLLHFIDAYRSLPELWDIECPSYSNRVKKAAAYDILIEKLKPLEPDAVRDSVVKKINNLRSTFRKELKKVNDSKRSGAGSDDVYVPSLWYFNELMFLVDQETPDTSESTFAVDNAVDNENSQESMVSNYKRKTNQGSWSEENLNMAIYECRNGTKISTAASLYNIPFTTLKRKTQRAEVLTTTPVKNIQLEKMKKAERKIINTVAKRPTRKSVRKSFNFESTKKKHQRTPLNIFVPYVQKNMYVDLEENQLKIGYNVTFVKSGIMRIVHHT